MKKIYGLLIILLFIGAIAVQAGPSVHVVLWATTPYNGQTRANVTISTTASVGDTYTNDNLASEISQGGYVEYQYDFTYSNCTPTQSTPSPDPTAWTKSKTCGTSGYFSSLGTIAGIAVTVTAHTCYSNGDVIPGSTTSDAASIVITVAGISNVSIDASSPNSTKSNYQTDPYACTINNVGFTAP